VAIDVRMELGPPQEAQNLRYFLLKPRPADSTTMLSETQIKSRLFTPNRTEITTLVGMRTTLQLTQQQVDTLAALHRQVLAVRDSLFTDLARHLASLQDRKRIPKETAERYRRAQLQSQLVLARLVPQIKTILTPAQKRKLPISITFWLDRDPRMIERMTGLGEVAFVSF
jgi:hypothetical protein